MTAAAYGSRISARYARLSGKTRLAFRFDCQTADTRRHLAAGCARGLRVVVPRKKRGSRECRMRAAPAVSCAKLCKKHAHEHTGSAEAIRHSLRNGFTAYFALSPAIRICLSPSPPRIDGWPDARSGRLHLLRDLTPTQRLSGPHDFTVRFSAVVSVPSDRSQAPKRPPCNPVTRLTLQRPPHPMPNVRDDHDTPLQGAGTGESIELICPTR